MSETAPDAVRFRKDQLEGFRIGVTSDRRSEDLIEAFRRRGAEVLHAPTVRMAHQSDDAAVLADTQQMIAARPEILLATTSYGIRRWFEVADAGGLGEALLTALGESAVLVRGPKARGGIRAAGLTDRGMSERETTASLVDMVLATFPDPVQVAVQLHGYTDEVQLDRLRAAGHAVLTVAPYRWLAPDTTDVRVERLIDAICTGALDAVTFTSAPGATATLDTARAMNLYDEFVQAFAQHSMAAAVGPVTARPLIAAGIRPVIPQRFRLGALIRLVCDELTERHVERFRCGEVMIEVGGRSVSVDGRHVLLGPNALTLFKTLAGNPSVVARQELIRSLPEELDDHALEVEMSRLRRALDVPGLITTVVRRGYRFNGQRV